MNQTTLVFPSLLKLAGFIQAVGLTNYEINYNTFRLSCEVNEEMICSAIKIYGAVLLSEALAEG